MLPELHQHLLQQRRQQPRLEAEPATMEMPPKPHRPDFPEDLRRFCRSC
jgi:hypothetical protein